MKKVLLITGILFIVLCVIFLLAAVFYLYAYRHTLDGSAELYIRLHGRAILFFIIGISLAAIGAVCVFVHSRL